MDVTTKIQLILTLSLYTMCASIFYFPFDVKVSKKVNILFMIITIIGYIGIVKLYMG